MSTATTWPLPMTSQACSRWSGSSRCVGMPSATEKAGDGPEEGASKCNNALEGARGMSTQLFAPAGCQGFPFSALRTCLRVLWPFQVASALERLRLSLAGKLGVCQRRAHRWLGLGAQGPWGLHCRAARLPQQSPSRRRRCRRGGTPRPVAGWAASLLAGEGACPGLREQPLASARPGKLLWLLLYRCRRQ